MPVVPLIERLRQVESSGEGEATTNWYRNPDGPEAADRIALLEEELRLAGEHLYLAAEAVDDWGAYAGAYFQTKHGLDGQIAEIKAQARQAAQALAETEVGGE